MFKTLKSTLILLILSGVSMLSHGQPFVLTSDNLLPLYSGPIKWADLDNDNDLDIIYSGFAGGANEFFVKVYENVAGSFTSRSTGLPNIRNGSFALGDYDKDGDLDILLSGLSGTGNISVLYQNLGAFSFSLKQSFPGIINTTASWFDIDNDEDLDFLLAGVDDNSGGPDPFVKKMMVYENVNGTFSLINGTNLPPCTQCSMDWADSNADGKIDLVITGFQGDINGNTDVYLNNGDKTFTKDQNSNFKDVYNGDVKWGDFDRDGDMDVLLSGVQHGGNIITSVYRNTSGVLHEETNIKIHSTGENWMDGTSWVDYNNDGLLDILISGRGTSVVVLEYIFKLYKNNGNGTFNEVSEANFTGLSDSSVDFGDFDNDGDVDFCFSGMSSTGPTTGIYKNKLIDGPYAVNSKPAPPSVTNLSEHFFRKQVKLKWPSGTDLQTPAAGLSYNFYLKYGTSNFIAPTSNFTSGYVMTTNPANGHSKSPVLNGIPEGNYSWAVQSVDGGKMGSLFSSEKTFYQINGPEAIKIEILDVGNVKLSWLDNSSIETSYQVARSTNPTAGFSPQATLPPNTTSYVDSYAFATDTYYQYRINAAATKASAYDSLLVVIPTAPANLLAQSVNASRIDLVWDDLSQYESGYDVQRKPSTGLNFLTIATLGSDTESYQDTGLSEGTSYDYRVRALVSNGSSAFSNTSTAKTNFRPSGANFTKQTIEDETITFAAKDFTDGFSDPDANDQLVKILIVTLPQKGILKLNDTPVTAGQTILVTDLKNLDFVPLLNANGGSAFNFYYNDGKDNSATNNIVTLTIVPVNDVPAFSIPPLVEANEDFTTQIKIIPATVPVPQDELSQVVIYSIQPVTSSKVTLTFNPTSGEMNFTSVLNTFGEVEFILLANDGQSINNTFSDTVKLVVKPVNDAPVLSTISDQEVEYQTAISPITFLVSDVDSPISSVVVSGSSGNQTLIKNGNITVQGTADERSIVLLPENTLGEALITLTANDGTATASTQFNFKVFSVTAILETFQGIKVFPNPFVSFINVTLPDGFGNGCTALLHDQLGQEVSCQLITTNEHTIDLAEIPSGVYLLSIFEIDGDILYRSRIIKN